MPTAIRPTAPTARLVWVATYMDEDAGCPWTAVGDTEDAARDALAFVLQDEAGYHDGFGLATEHGHAIQLPICAHT